MPEKHAPLKAYAAYSLNEETHISSASGGAAYELARHIVNGGGIVYSSMADSELNVSVYRCDNLSELKKFSGSKYVHSHVNTAFSDIKDDLENGLTVLFTGTPCQVAGLKGYLKGKEYPSLYTADIICHGVPSRETFISYSKALLMESFESADSVSFRNGSDYELSYYSGDKLLLSRPWKSDLYLTSFLEGSIFRENCYYCKYAEEKRVSDITLGDFWGIDKTSVDEETQKRGLNVVLINTKRGAELFSAVSEKLFTAEREVSEAVNGNEQLRHPCEKTEYARKFRELCGKYPNDKALKMYSAKRRILCDIRDAADKNDALKRTLGYIPGIKDKI